MALTTAALQTELQTDPNTYGYAPLIAGGNHTGLADLLNLIRPEISINRGRIPVDEVKEAIAPADFSGLTQAQMSGLIIMLSGETVNAESSTVRTILANLFAAGSATRANLVTLVTRTGSRAEQLFGREIIVTHLDIGAALEG